MVGDMFYDTLVFYVTLCLCCLSLNFYFRIGNLCMNEDVMTFFGPALHLWPATRLPLFNKVEVKMFLFTQAFRCGLQGDCLEMWHSPRATGPLSAIYHSITGNSSPDLTPPLPKGLLVLSRCSASVSTSSKAAKCIRRLLDGQGKLQLAVQWSLKCSHGYLLHGNNRAIVVQIDGTPLATNRRKYASALFFFTLQ